jgi:hypothetical protein
VSAYNYYGGEHAIFNSDEGNFRIFAALFFNDSFTIFSIASVDINKIFVFYHLFVHGFQLKKLF